MINVIKNLKYNKIILVICLVYLFSLNSYSQGLGGLINKVKSTKEKVIEKNTKLDETIKSDVPSISSEDIKPNKFYRITNVATGQELAITLIYDANIALDKSIYKSSLELKPVTNNEDSSQTWFFYHSNSSNDPSEQQIGSKVGFTSTKSGYILRLSNPNIGYSQDDKVNNMQMYHNVGEYNDYWHFYKLSNGYFRIINEFGIAKRLNVKFEEQNDHWNEERSVEAVKINGKVKLKQMKTADIAAQYWKLTEVGDITNR